MNKHKKTDYNLALEAHDILITLGVFSIKYANIERLPHYSQGRPENDAEHSYLLAICAIELAYRYYPKLDTGLISQFCLMHDFPEIYAGDTPSFKLTETEKAKKEEAESLATERLLNELPQYTARLLSRYEEQKEPEARFVRLVDKIMPGLVHAIAPDANREVFLGKYKLKTIEELRVTSKVNLDELKVKYPEFEFIHSVLELIAKTSREKLFEKQPKKD